MVLRDAWASLRPQSVWWEQGCAAPRACLGAGLALLGPHPSPVGALAGRQRTWACGSQSAQALPAGPGLTVMGCSPGRGQVPRPISSAGQGSCSVCRGQAALRRTRSGQPASCHGADSLPARVPARTHGQGHSSAQRWGLRPDLALQQAGRPWAQCSCGDLDHGGRRATGRLQTPGPGHCHQQDKPLSWGPTAPRGPRQQEATAPSGWGRAGACSVPTS